MNIFKPKPGKEKTSEQYVLEIELMKRSLDDALLQIETLEKKLDDSIEEFEEIVNEMDEYSKKLKEDYDNSLAILNRTGRLNSKDLLLFLDDMIESKKLKYLKQLNIQQNSTQQRKALSDSQFQDDIQLITTSIMVSLSEVYKRTLLVLFSNEDTILGYIIDRLHSDIMQHYNTWNRNISNS